MFHGNEVPFGNCICVPDFFVPRKIVTSWFVWREWIRGSTGASQIFGYLKESCQSGTKNLQLLKQGGMRLGGKPVHELPRRNRQLHHFFLLLDQTTKSFIALWRTHLENNTQLNSIPMMMTRTNMMLPRRSQFRSSIMALCALLALVSHGIVVAADERVTTSTHRDATDTAAETPEQQRRELFWSLTFLSKCTCAGINSNTLFPHSTSSSVYIVVDSHIVS